MCQPITPQDKAKCHEIIESIYGQEYEFQKMEGIYALLADDGWSGERLRRTVIHLCKHHKWPNFKPADFNEVGLGQLHNYEWMLAEVAKDRTAASRMEAYLLGTDKQGRKIIMYRYKEPVELPLTKLYRIEKQEEEQVPIKVSAKPPKEILEFLAKGKPADERMQSMTLLEDLMPKVNARNTESNS